MILTIFFILQCINQMAAIAEEAEIASAAAEGEAAAATSAVAKESVQSMQLAVEDDEAAASNNGEPPNAAEVDSMCKKGAARALQEPRDADGNPKPDREPTPEEDKAVDEAARIAENIKTEEEAADLVINDASVLTPKSRAILEKTRARYAKGIQNIKDMLQKMKNESPEHKTVNDKIEACDKAAEEVQTLRKSKPKDPKALDEWNAKMKAAKKAHANAGKEVHEAIAKLPSWGDYLTAKGGRYSVELSGKLIEYGPYLLALGGFLLFLKLTSDALSGCYIYRGVKSFKLPPPTEGGQGGLSAVCQGGSICIRSSCF